MLNINTTIKHNNICSKKLCTIANKLNGYNNVTVTFSHISPFIGKFEFKQTFCCLDYKVYNKTNIKIRLSGKLPLTEIENTIKRKINTLVINNSCFQKIFDNLLNLSRLPYIKSIRPINNRDAEKYDITELTFLIEFEDFIHSKFVKESIGKYKTTIENISEKNIENKYAEYREKAFENLNTEFITYSLNSNKSYKQLIYTLKELCKNIKEINLNIQVSEDKRHITLLNSLAPVYEYEFDKNSIFGVFEKQVEDNFITNINKQIKQYNKTQKYISIINSCKNKIWQASYIDSNSVIITLSDNGKKIAEKNIFIYDTDNIKEKLYSTMKNLLAYAENYCGIRFLEESV